MNPGIDHLQPYPFEKLSSLLDQVTLTTKNSAIDLSKGEPGHITPGFILDALEGSLAQCANYPATRGGQELRSAIAGWLIKRFHLPAESLQADKHVLPVNGTREALFAFAQCIINNSKNNPIVITPNPFYQIYEGAALLAGANPYFINCQKENDFLPDFTNVPEEIWKDCQLLYLCSPNNPTGFILSQKELTDLLELADEHDFIIAADECYSEIYADETNPPPGLLQAAANSGRDNYQRCIVFHSLSKRSNVPGMRSGFVAGDADLIQLFYKYRTYHGCSMPPFIQFASTLAWQDEEHVVENRKLYREKFAAVLDILNPVIQTNKPDGGFYLWPETPIPDTDFAAALYKEQNIKVLPGSYLSRPFNGCDPGKNHVRIALVPDLDTCLEAAERIKNVLENL